MGSLGPLGRVCLLTIEVGSLSPCRAGVSANNLGLVSSLYSMRVFRVCKEVATPTISGQKTNILYIINLNSRSGDKKNKSFCKGGLE